MANDISSFFKTMGHKFTDKVGHLFGGGGDDNQEGKHAEA